MKTLFFAWQSEIPRKLEMLLYVTNITIVLFKFYLQIFLIFKLIIYNLLFKKIDVLVGNGEINIIKF